MFRIYNQYLEGQDTDSVREVCVANIHIEYTVHNKENTHLYANMFAWWDKNTQTQTSVMGSTGGLADAARSAGKQTNTKLTSEQPSQSQKILQRQVFTSFHHNLCLIYKVSVVPQKQTRP